MFTGIIEEKGKVRELRKQSACWRLRVEVNKVHEDVAVGDSISVNGVCLTVAASKDRSLFFDIMPETFNVSTLKVLRVSQEVNCERALKVGDRVGGHFVSGHVDGIGVIRSKKTVRGNVEFQVSLPAPLLKYCVRKGSVAVDGISLTIADVRSGCFFVAVIPHTVRVTTLGLRHPGDKVNVECDMLAKLSIQPVCDKLI
jgi:riboflavin synthase